MQLRQRAGSDVASRRAAIWRRLCASCLHLSPSRSRPAFVRPGQDLFVRRGSEPVEFVCRLCVRDVNNHCPMMMPQLAAAATVELITVKAARSRWPQFTSHKSQRRSTIHREIFESKCLFYCKSVCLLSTEGLQRLKHGGSPRRNKGCDQSSCRYSSNSHNRRLQIKDPDTKKHARNEVVQHNRNA
jgi:hypothetical protein